MTKPRVLIGLPTMGSISVLLAVNIMAWLSQAAQKKHMDIGVYPTLRVQPVDNARNQIVEEFLKSNYTHLFFVDSDTIPPVDALDRLLAMDKDIATAITPIVEMDEKGEPWRKWNVVDQTDTNVQPNTGIIEAKGAGSSCILIKRSVFERLDKPYYSFITATSSQGNEKQVSEDIHFIVKALNKGIKTYADTSIIAKHEKVFIF